MKGILTKDLPGARIGLAALLMLAILLPFTALAARGAAPDAEVATTVERKTERFGDQVVVFSGDLEVPADVRLRGNIVCIGGDAVIAGEVTGDVVVIFGRLDLTGQADRSVTGVMSKIRMNGGRVGRELVNVLGSLELSETTVERDLFNILGGLTHGEDSPVGGDLVNVGFWTWLPNLTALMFWLRLFLKLLVFLLILLLVALVPDRIRAIGEEVPTRYLAAFWVGLLGYLGLLVILGVLSITVVGVLPAMIAFYVFRWMGIAAVFYAIGRRLGRAAGREMSVPGAVLLTFALYVAVTLAPTPLGLFGLIGSSMLWLLFFVFIDLPAVGMMILTRAGSPPQDARPVVPVGPPAAPPPPMTVPRTERGDAVHDTRKGGA